MALAALCSTACDGRIGDPGASGPSAMEDPGEWYWGGVSGDGGTGSPGAPPPLVPEEPAPTSRFPRLSHAQWESTTRDLLKLPAPSGLSAGFVADATSGTFDNEGGALRIGANLWQSYQSAAESLAERATSTPAALALIAPTTAGDAPTRARAFVTGFGARAFRRPLADAEITRYAALFALGPTVYSGLEPFTAGVRLVVTAMLQSPNFLYRVESSTRVEGAVVRLTDWEFAARLSYALWNTMPDEELSRAAAAGELGTPEGVRAQLRRMLTDARAEGTVDAFHRQLLGTGAYADVTRPTDRFPEFSPELRTSMLGEVRGFVRSVVFGDHRGFAELMTAPYSFVDARLARVYGLAGSFDASFRRAPLDPTRRAGLLTQIGFLATNAASATTDPIHRGVFVNHRLLCAQLPPPPNNVPPLPVVTGTLTMRQRVNAHTGPGTCGAGCHGTMINPIGFGLEHYDALGRWQDTDNGMPVDARDHYSFEGQDVSFDGGVELARAIAAAPMAHRCYVRHWLEYAYGRAPAATDEPLLARIAGASLERQLPVLDVIAELVMSRAFATRATTEVAQ